MVLAFMPGRPGWLYLFFFYLSAACVVLIMVAFPFDESSALWRAVRNVYPLVLFIFFYRAIGPQIFMVFDKPFDPAVHRLELNIFGVDPAFYWQKYMDVWLNELMNFGYFSYYLLLPSAVVAFVLMKKWKSLDRLMLSSAIAFYICYILYIFCPVVGPRFFLSDIYYLPIFGPFFTPLTQKVVDFGGHYGAAMPSSHCAIALIVAWRVSRDLKGLMFPAILVSILLCLGTIYCRFHYLTDVLAGLIIGVLGIWAADRWIARFTDRREIIPTPEVIRIKEESLAADLKDS
jgi:membrane-associated phospholipid phosphatase